MKIFVVAVMLCLTVPTTLFTFAVCQYLEIPTPLPILLNMFSCFGVAGFTIRALDKGDYEIQKTRDRG